MNVVAPALLMHQTQLLGVTVAAYLAKSAGDGIARHEHDFDHSTACTAGRLLVSTDDKQVELTPDHAPVLLRKYVPHSIVALENGTRFENIMPY